jgi:hypothetical protein
MLNFKEHKKKKLHNSRFLWKSSDLVFGEPSKTLKEEVHDYNNPEITNNKQPTNKKEYEKITKQFKEHGKKLTDSHKQSIGFYKDDEYAHINNHLRGLKADTKYGSYKKETIKKHINNLSDVTSGRVKTPIVTYRGQEHAAEKHKFPIGATFKDKGFVSTSLDHRKAKEFVTENPNRPTHLFKIHLKPGDKAHHIDQHVHESGSFFENEHEIVVHKGTTFKVTHHEYNKPSNTHFIHLHVHSQED